MSTKSSSADSSLPSRKLAIKLLLAVLKDGQSLSSLSHLYGGISSRDVSFARMLSFGVLRFYHQLLGQLKPFMKKPLKNKDLDIQLILLMALYQLMHTRVPEYAVVDMAVKHVRKTRKSWAGGMVNGVLRNFIRQLESGKVSKDSFQIEEAEFAHPQWMIEKLKTDWPDKWKEILQGNNQQAPMSLRVNRQKISRDEFLEALKQEQINAMASDIATDAVILEEAMDVTQVPGFEGGWFSVQDVGAQLAAHILNPQPQDRVLDACAAPGGKTSHLFELQPDIELTALDISESRLQRVGENCQRLGFKHEIKVADAANTEEWWDGKPYDRILLDVPCSASGVIRRHPDIKHLRREEDISELQQLQREILSKNWDLLKPGGLLLYATCSLFRDENEKQVDWFLSAYKNASLVEITQGTHLHETSIVKGLGLQLLPTRLTNDGFYYALLEKQ